MATAASVTIYRRSAVLTLALGIGASAVLYSLVHGVVLRPLPFPEPDRLVLVFTAHRDHGLSGTSLHDALDWQDQGRGVLRHLAVYENSS